MKIKIRDIPRNGLDIKKVIAAGEINLAGEDTFQCLSPLSIEGNIDRVDDTVLAKIEIKGTYGLTCARCLEPVKQDRTDKRTLVFEVDSTTEMIDLGEDIRQEILVSVSSVALCSDGCKGLCINCGANLNLETCKCKC